MVLMIASSIPGMPAVQGHLHLVDGLIGDLGRGPEVRATAELDAEGEAAQCLALRSRP